MSEQTKITIEDIRDLETKKIPIALDGETAALVEDWRRLLNNRRTVLLLAVIVGLEHKEDLTADIERTDIVKMTVELPVPVVAAIEREADRLGTNRSVVVCSCVRTMRRVADNGGTIQVNALLPVPTEVEED